MWRPSVKRASAVVVVVGLLTMTEDSWASTVSVSLPVGGTYVSLSAAEAAIHAYKAPNYSTFAPYSTTTPNASTVVRMYNVPGYPGATPGTWGWRCNSGVNPPFTMAPDCPWCVAARTNNDPAFSYDKSTTAPDPFNPALTRTICWINYTAPDGTVFQDYEAASIDQAYSCPAGTAPNFDSSACLPAYASITVTETCDAGYVSSPNGCVATCADPNASWNGVACECNAGFAPVNGVCTSTVCGDPHAAWNGATCACVTGYRPDPNTNTCVPSCDEQTCSAACSGTSADILPFYPEVSFDLALDCSAWSSWLPKGAGGGKFGVSFKTLQADQALRSASCANGCTSELTTKRSFEVSMSVCAKPGPAISASTDWTSKTTYGKTCDNSSCSTVCDSTKSCVEDSTSVALAGGQALDLTQGGGLGFSRFGVTVGCSAKDTMLIGGKFTAADVTNTDFGGKCPAGTTPLGTVGPGGSCTADTLAVTSSLSASMSCKIALGDFPLADAGGSVSWSTDLSGTKKKGGCGDELCFTSKFAYGFKWSLGSACATVLGRTVKIQGSGDVAMTNCSYTSCLGGSQGCNAAPTQPWKLTVAGNCNAP